MRLGYIADALEVNAKHAHCSHAVFTLYFLRFTGEVLDVHFLWQPLRDVAVSSSAHFGDVHRSRDGGAAGNQLKFPIAILHGLDNGPDVGVEGLFPDKNHSAIAHGSHGVLRAFIP